MAQQIEMLSEPKSKKERPVLKTAEDVVAALRLRYPSQSYAMLEQVGNSTGFRCNRHCDVLLMSLWPSRGLEIIGIEVKVRRSDWLKELATPEKAEPIAQYCDRWYLAVGDENIVQNGELPKGWGLLVPKKDGGMRCAAEATLAEPEPQPDRNFLAAVLRQIQSQLLPEAKLLQEYQRGKKDTVKEAKESYERTREYDKRQLDDLKKAFNDFEKASGVRIRDGWRSAAQIGNAVQRVLDGYDGRVSEQLRSLHRQAIRIADGIAAELKKDEVIES